MLMLSLGFGPAFPMNLKKDSRKLHFQAFDGLLPVQKKWGACCAYLLRAALLGFRY